LACIITAATTNIKELSAQTPPDTPNAISAARRVGPDGTDEVVPIPTSIVETVGFAHCLKDVVELPCRVVPVALFALLVLILVARVELFDILLTFGRDAGPLEGPVGLGLVFLIVVVVFVTIVVLGILAAVLLAVAIVGTRIRIRVGLLLGVLGFLAVVTSAAIQAAILPTVFVLIVVAVTTFLLLEAFDTTHLFLRGLAQITGVGTGLVLGLFVGRIGIAALVATLLVTW
jgi:hypothetical protein